MQIRAIQPAEIEAARQLLAANGWAPFYEKLGFVGSDVAMERPRAK